MYCKEVSVSVVFRRCCCQRRYERDYLSQSVTLCALLTNTGCGGQRADAGRRLRDHPVEVAGGALHHLLRAPRPAREGLEALDHQRLVKD
jgi:hypothetical protein